jgi:hypothetical protein
MEKYLLNEKTGVICKEGTSEMDITLLGEVIEKEDKFVLEAIKENGDIVEAELSKEEYFNGKEFTIKVEKKENNILTTDILIEVGQKFSDGHLIMYTEKADGTIEFLIYTEENGEQSFTYTSEEVIKLAKKYGVIKVKGLKLVNKENEIMEFDSVNEFYNHLLAETGKEKINKGLLYIFFSVLFRNRHKKIL